jgi:hypothetical protein
MLLPPSVEDYVDENNPVRAIAAFRAANAKALRAVNKDFVLLCWEPGRSPNRLRNLPGRRGQSPVPRGRRSSRTANRGLPPAAERWSCATAVVP